MQEQAAAEMAAAQRELQDACDETGMQIRCVRAPGGMTPESVRALTRFVRERAAQGGNAEGQTATAPQ